MLKGLERDKVFLQHVADGRYTVSEEGIIRKRTGKIIGNPKNEFVVIGKDGNYFSLTRTRAVWLVFKGLIPEVNNDAYYVVFKNREKPLHIDNLELKLRTQMSSELGKKAVAYLNPKGVAKLADEQVLALRREFVANSKAFVIRQRAKELGVTHATLSSALSGKTFANVAESVPKELMKKPGGNQRPRVWDRKNCPSYTNRVSRPKQVKSKKEKTDNVVTFKPRQTNPVIATPKMSDKEKQDRLEMMKRIGRKLGKVREVD